MPDTVLDPLAATADAGQARGVSPDPLSELVDLAVEPTVAVALRAVREMLGMEVAYLSEFVGEDAVLRAVEGEGKSFGLAPELSMPRHHTYCQGALDGRLSNLIPDARADDRTASMAVTKAANVGAFATVPLTFSDGRLYGTLCAASHDAKSLDFRALQFLKVFARLLADQLERDEAALVVGHLAALVNAAGDAIMCLTSAGMVTSWNAACERIFGYAATDAIGHDIIDLIALPSREADMRRSLLVGRLADALGRHRAQKALRGANHALEIRVRDRTADLRRAVAELDAAQVETVRRLSRAVEFRDEDTGAHIARISAFAARTAQQAGLDAEQIGLIERASPLHDVGKVAIPDSVLLKPGPLTPAERAVIETHAEIGHRLLDGSDSAVLQLAAIIALTHHEHHDGGGYPQGLAGENIPIEGRIVAIADVFDALTSDRVYRPAMTVEQALAILQAGRSTHFDPVLLDHFLADLHHEPLLRT
jgi:PAS domain S-box-containing protein